MRRAALLIAVLLAACVEHGSTPDGDGSGSGSGSGSNALLDDVDPSPPDVTLEWFVVGLSLVVVIGPARLRRRDAKRHQI